MGSRILRALALVVALPIAAVALIGIGAGFVAGWLVIYAEDGEWPS